MLATGFTEASGQSWTQVGELLLAFALSSVIGLERQVRGKSAGLRTQAIVGTAAALIVLVSKYGFSDVLVDGRVALDPSRVAAQIVSGVGFLGAGLIITRQGAIRGLTTAAAVWETAAVGMAAAAGLPVLAAVVTALHFVIVLGYTALTERLPVSRAAVIRVRITYADQRGVLRRLLAACTGRNWAVLGVSVQDQAGGEGVHELLRGERPKGPGLAAVVLTLQGPNVAAAPATLADIPAVVAVARAEDDTE